MAFYNKDINQIFKELNSNKNGLSNEVAAENIKKFGENKLDKSNKPNFLKKVMLQFKNIMIIILFAPMILELLRIPHIIQPFLTQWMNYDIMTQKRGQL